MATISCATARASLGLCSRKCELMTHLSTSTSPSQLATSWKAARASRAALRTSFGCPRAACTFTTSSNACAAHILSSRSSKSATAFFASFSASSCSPFLQRPATCRCKHRTSFAANGEPASSPLSSRKSFRASTAASRPALPSPGSPRLRRASARMTRAFASLRRSLISRKIRAASPLHLISSSSSASALTSARPSVSSTTASSLLLSAHLLRISCACATRSMISPSFRLSPKRWKLVSNCIANGKASSTWPL
mmetsp:Transcript_19316/g.41016  ORF Transcript_19316/g.41016 Transcript_19316/m.41016 type:complete len:253 (+) Transcript_19316:847-1605(+)